MSDGRTPASPATEKQKRFVWSLLSERKVSRDIRKRATSTNLTDGDCRELIPLLKEAPRKYSPMGYGDGEEWYSPEGYDDSPDMGVHRFDGGGSWW